MENIIKEELPAHILPKICWVGHRENDLKNIKEQSLQELENEKNVTLEQLDKQIDTIQNEDLTQEEKDIQIATIELQKLEASLLIERRKNKYLKSFKDLEEFEKNHLKQLENEEAITLQLLDDQIVLLQNEVPLTTDILLQIIQLKVEKIQESLLSEKEKMEYLESIEDRTSDLVEFENRYQAYLFAKTSLGQKQPEELKDFLTAIGNLNTIYPVGRLLDCDDENDELEGKIILGQTNIGTL